MSKSTRGPVLAILAAILVVGGYAFYRSPQGQEIFTRPDREESPLEFLERLPDIEPIETKPQPLRNRQDAVPDRQSQRAAEPAAPYRNRVPNSEVASTVMQILAARGLASGVSVSASDTRVEVSGTVKSRADREQILDILEKAREARRIDAAALVVEEQ